MATKSGTTSEAEVPGHFITLIEAVVRNIPRNVPRVIALRNAGQGGSLAPRLAEAIYPEGQPVNPSRLREKLDEEIARFAKAGEKQAAILVLIEALQYHFSSHQDELPYGNDLEWLMRAIKALYWRGSQPDPSYVANKLWNGISRLLGALKEKLPGFSEQWSKYSL